MLYEVTKRLEIAGAHSLCLSYPSKCSRVHGHNWIIEITVQASELNVCGMVVDFALIKQRYNDMFDHQTFNVKEPFRTQNPTAENIAGFILQDLNNCLSDCESDYYNPDAQAVMVAIWESENNKATVSTGSDYM